MMCLFKTLGHKHNDVPAEKPQIKDSSDASIYCTQAYTTY